MANYAWGQLYIQADIPTSPPAIVGSLWLDLDTGVLNRCTSISPVTFTPVVAGGAGTGDVVGPDGATNNAIVRYDGTTGKLVQDSSVTIEDNGDMIGKSFVGTRSGTIVRTGENISSVQLTGGRTLTINRDGNGTITSISDGTRTTTINRDGNDDISGWTVS